MSAADRQSGFTLVEVLVALVVTSLLLAIIFDGSITGRKREKLAADHAKAVLLADTLLADAAAQPYRQGVREGASHGLNWTVSERLASVDPRGAIGLVALDTRISDRDKHQLLTANLLRLKTLAPQ